MNRIIALDIAKAICIILVVMGHYVPDNSPAWYVLVHDVIYTFHMPLFMFVSGYVYIATKKRSTYGDFLLKKVRRLMVPYLTTSVMVIVIKHPPQRPDKPQEIACHGHIKHLYERKYCHGIVYTHTALC